VGLVGNTGSWIDQITVACASVKPDLTLTGPRTIASRDGSGGAFKQSFCKNDEVVTEVNISRTANYEIQHVMMKCSSIRTWAANSVIFGGSGSYKTAIM